MKSIKKLTNSQKEALELRIKGLLFGGLDWCVNTKKDPSYWFSPNNPYCSEAFGLMHALEVLGFGYFGANNVDSQGNLRFWFDQLKDEVKLKGEELGAKESYLWFTYNKN